MSREAETWTLKGFLTHLDFVHNKMPDHAFAWVLGAGASLPSGIPTGGTLVNRWLRELHERLDTSGKTVEAWATEESLEIKKFEYEKRAAFYPRIYERRFRDNPEEGYAYLEDLMADKEPSPGYSILAKIMEKHRHKVVISTNFDNLVADAMAIYTAAFPFVCGHESLTSFVRTSMRRPLVCKIHRDLLLGPQNDTRSLRRLHDAWGATLHTLLRQYSPIFIGYGGNDDTLMDLLEAMEPGEMPGQMIWCYYEKSEPSQRIRELVAQHHGALVPVPDFDVLMLYVGWKMGVGPMDELFQERAKDRLEKYRTKILNLDLARHLDLIPALEASFVRGGLGWWVWNVRARAEKNPAERRRLYQAGIEQYPNSHQLHGNLAAFLSQEGGDMDEAEKLYRQALELKPDHANITGNFATFMADVRKNQDEAEKLYHRALELNPNHANHTCNYAGLLIWRDKLDDARPLVERALTLNRWAINPLTGEALFYKGLLDGCSGHDDSTALGQLKTLLESGYERGRWSFEPMLETAKKRLPAREVALYEALAAAILDASRVKDSRRLRSLAIAPARSTSGGGPDLIGRYPDVVGGCPDVVGGCPDVVGGCPNVVGGCPDVVGGCPDVVGGCPDVVAGCPDVVGGCPDVVAGCPDVVGGCPDVVAGCPDVVAGCPDVVAGCFDRGEGATFWPMGSLAALVSVRKRVPNTSLSLSLAARENSPLIVANA